MNEPEALSRSWHACLLIVAGASGAAVLGLEVLAARVIAPSVGTGSVAWSCLLAVALGALAVGNLLGGMLSDRVRPDVIISWALAVASAALVALALAYLPLLRWAAALPLAAAGLAGALVTQGIPMLALGTVAPAILRSAGPGNARGRWAGAVLACGSGGAVVGAMCAGLWLLPVLGLTRSYLVFALLLAVTTMPTVLRARRWGAGALALLSALAAIGCWFAPADRDVIQSRYGQIEVRDTEIGRVLLIDGLLQTGLPPGGIAPGDGLRYGCLIEAAFLVRPHLRDALVIGLGAGLAPRLIEAHGVSCQSVELDPRVVEVARERFGFEGPVAVADGRRYLLQTPRKWDLIVLDVCTSERLPWHLFTVEAMSAARARLRPGGVLAVQFIGDGGPWSAAVYRTVKEVFGSAVMLTPRGRVGPVSPCVILTGSPPLPPMPRELAEGDPNLPWDMVVPQSRGSLLTDDHFPAEIAWARTATQWRRMYAFRR